MSRADLNLKAKGTDLPPQKPGRTAARKRDQLRKRHTPRIRKLIARRSLSIRVAKAAETKARRLAEGGVS